GEDAGVRVVGGERGDVLVGGGRVEARPHDEDRLVSSTVCVTAAGSPSPASAQHVRVAGDVGRGEGCEAVTGDEPAARGEAAIAAPCQPPSGAGRRISPAGARAGTRRPGPSGEQRVDELLRLEGGEVVGALP